MKYGLPVQVEDSKHTIYHPVARWIRNKTPEVEGPLFIGVNGAQGSGKTTFCALLSSVLLHDFGLHSVSMSIDDIYHTRAIRNQLGKEVHPLCKIRGVPGTHDVGLAHRVFDQAAKASDSDPLLIPRFDKALDDRQPKNRWDVISTPPDVVLFEGWCVGCPPLHPWTGPFNDREEREDPEGIWSKWSSNCLENEHRPLFQRLDSLIFIGVPSMETVRKSRWLQEKKLWEKMQNRNDETAHLPGLMTEEAVTEYIALFERYTEHMLAHMPALADTVIMRDSEFRYTLKHLPQTP